ncbi:glycosyl hydrolase family 35 [Spirochaetia bacterium]|nr:glycosyl hydrolase family 35 [Spirochaetia bacterium]
MHIQERNIVDEQDRTLILRGVNLGGSSKNPFGPPGAALKAESLKNPAEVSFVNRPFPLEEADAHFDRLVDWGFTFIRLVITWEALEHAGPGIYDEAYLAYLRKLLLIAEKKGITVYMDPHQDAWSRWTGGDGAPAWTLEMLGMDLDRLDITGAALTWQRWGELHRGKYPHMIWPSNYDRYAAATMFTLFFAGNTFAPDLLIEGTRVQEWLQEHYIAAFRHCYRRLKNCGAILGWGTMNEPHQGFTGHRDLGKAENPMIPMGPMPSPFQTMAAASGRPVKIPVYALGGKWVIGHETLNPKGLSLFKEGFSCPWKQAGIWTDEGGEPQLLRKDHFARYQGKPVRFTDDFLKPFMLRFIERMQEPNPAAVFFLDGLPMRFNTSPADKIAGDMREQPHWQEGDPPMVVNAFHRYDGATLFTKSFRPWLGLRVDTMRPLLGRKQLSGYFRDALAEETHWTRDHMDDIPCLLGEFGLPFDMNHKKAFKNGDYSLHEEALSIYYDAVDANLLHSTIWNYTADNTNEAGDGWNGEDLSIFSGKDGRARAGWLRPYAMATAGTPLSMQWDRKTGTFTYCYRADPEIKAPTEVFLPAEWFSAEPAVEVRAIQSKTVKPAEEAAKKSIIKLGRKKTGAPEIKTQYQRNIQRLFIIVTDYEGEVKVIVRNV